MVATTPLTRREFSRLAVSLCILLVGCSRNANASSKVKEALKLEQTANHTVLGRRDQNRFEYVDMTSGGARWTVNLSEPQEVAAGSIDLRKGDEIKSTDEKWTAHCGSNAECRISKVGDSSMSFSVSRKGILTPLYWSPDERFVFFVRKNIWPFPPHCSLEDERDLVVYDLTEKSKGTIGTVCGGYPFWRLRWYKLPADSR